MEKAKIALLIRNQFFVEDCFVNKEDFLSLKLYSDQKKETYNIELDPYWRIEKHKEPFLGSIDEDEFIVKKLPILKKKKLVDFAVNDFSDLLLTFDEEITLEVFRANTSFEDLRWPKYLFPG